MDRNANLKFSERVILLDVSFLKQTVGMVKEIMSARLNRPLPKLDLVAWLDCLLLDVGIRDFSSAEVQVLLAHGVGGDNLDVCMPSLLSDLDAKACRTSLAEYVFSVVPAENMVAGETLFQDLLALVLNNASVRQLLLVPGVMFDEERLNGLMAEVLRERKGNAGSGDVQTVCFQIEVSALPSVCQWCPVVPSLAHVLGIGSEEL